LLVPLSSLAHYWQLAHLLERTAQAIKDVLPLAFSSGVKVGARVTILVGPLPSGPVLGVELVWDGVECRQGRYPPWRIQRKGDGGVVAWKLPDVGEGRILRVSWSVAFYRRVGGARGGVQPIGRCINLHVRVKTLVINTTFEKEVESCGERFKKEVDPFQSIERLVLTCLRVMF
jgi:hypothetical protein